VGVRDGGEFEIETEGEGWTAIQKRMMMVKDS